MEVFVDDLVLERGHGTFGDDPSPVHEVESVADFADEVHVLSDGMVQASGEFPSVKHLVKFDLA